MNILRAINNFKTFNDYFKSKMSVKMATPIQSNGHNSILTFISPYSLFLYFDIVLN